MTKTRDVTEWIWLSVITTNGGNATARVPADEGEYNRTDRRAVRSLEDFAERVGTYIQRTERRII